MTRAIWGKKNGTWHQIPRPFVFLRGSWHSINAVWAHRNGSWQQVFPNFGAVLFNTPGAASWTVPDNVVSVDITMVGGGGGGGTGVPGRPGGGGGGGGAGQVIQYNNVQVTPGTVFNLYVGNGGKGAGNFTGYAGSNGETTYLDQSGSRLTAGGGGGGGGTVAQSNFMGANNSPPSVPPGGSGGGGAACGDTGIQAGAVAPAGANTFNGAAGWSNDKNADFGGGGGGAGGDGVPATSAGPGNGGDGVTVTLIKADGTTVLASVAAGGAGGALGTSYTPATGGIGGGGDTAANNATNYGSGGGGGGRNSGVTPGPAGTGYQGVIYISWPGGY